MRKSTLLAVFTLLLIFIPGITLPGRAEVYLVDFDESQAEFLMLEAINMFRYENNLPLLCLDDDLSRASSHHALDMSRRDYFDHYSPEGETPDDRAHSVGVPDNIYENIGIIRTFGQDVTEVVTALMEGFLNSPSHRANLLNPYITHVGIGFHQDMDGTNSRLSGNHDPDSLYRGYGTVLVVQDFCTRNVRLIEPDPFSGWTLPGEFMTLVLSFSEDVDEAFLRICPDDNPTKSYDVPLAKTQDGFRARFAIEDEGAFSIGIYGSSPEESWFYREQGRLELTVKSQLR